MADYNFWISARSWMYNRIDPYTGNFTEEFVAGVEGFLEFAGNQPLALENNGKIYCPCILCKNEVRRPGRKVSNHLYGKGFMPGYHIWFNHGEEFNIDVGTSHGNINPPAGSCSYTGNYEENIMEQGEGERYVEMVHDAFNETMNPGNLYHDEGYHENAGPNAESQKKFDMLEAASNPLYDGCHEGHSRLSVASWMMNIKASNEMSENCVDQCLDLISRILPEGNTATSSYYELEKLMRTMGLRYHTIDVCQKIV